MEHDPAKKMKGDGLWMSFWYFLIILRFVISIPLCNAGKYALFFINRQSNICWRLCND